MDVDSDTDDAGPSRAELLDVLDHMDNTLVVLDQASASLAGEFSTAHEPEPAWARAIRYLLGLLRVEHARLAPSAEQRGEGEIYDGDCYGDDFGATLDLLECLVLIVPPRRGLDHMVYELQARVEDLDPDKRQKRSEALAELEGAEEPEEPRRPYLH